MNIKTVVLTLGLVLIIIILAAGYLNKNKPGETGKTTVNDITKTNTPAATGVKTEMKLTSTAFSSNQKIPVQYTCDGNNINPPLTISGVPGETVSLALTVDDPDAPAGTWTHWTVWNINAKTTEIAADSIPGGSSEGKTDFGKPGYGGPCPPTGTHRYFFKLYALDTNLSLAPSASKKELESAMAGHILNQAELIGLYSRK